MTQWWEKEPSGMNRSSKDIEDMLIERKAHWENQGYSHDKIEANISGYNCRICIFASVEFSKALTHVMTVHTQPRKGANQP